MLASSNIPINGNNTAQGHSFPPIKMETMGNSAKMSAFIKLILLLGSLARPWPGGLTLKRFPTKGLLLVLSAQLGLYGCSNFAIPDLNYQTQRDLDALAFDSIPPPNYTRGLIPRRTVTPLYPVRAQNLRIEGWTLLSFSVDAEGNVMGNTITVVESEPPQVFDRPSITAARQLSFDNSLEQTVEDVRYVFRYQLEEKDVLRSAELPVEPQFRELIPVRHLTPAYPEYALEQQIEGYTVVEFTVNANGSVSDVVVVESQPEHVFDNVAIETASRFRFEPRLIFNTPTRVEQVSYRFDWKLPQ